MKHPKLSIIIPTYNAGETIVGTLESVADQDFQDCEIIVVDGSSTDDTAEKVRTFEFPIHWSSQADKGVYEALNRGVELSSGEWLYFLGANDKIAPIGLSKLLNCAEEGADILFGNIEYVNAQNNKIPKLHKGSYGRSLKFKNTLHHQGSIYRKSIFDTLRFDDTLKVLADYDVNLFCWKSGMKAIFCDVLVATCDAAGLSKQFNKSLYQEELTIKRKHLTQKEMFLQHIWVWLKYGYKNL